MIGPKEDVSNLDLNDDVDKWMKKKGHEVEKPWYMNYTWWSRNLHDEFAKIDQKNPGEFAKWLSTNDPQIAKSLNGTGYYTDPPPPPAPPVPPPPPPSTSPTQTATTPGATGAPGSVPDAPTSTKKATTADIKASDINAPQGPGSTEGNTTTKPIPAGRNGSPATNGMTAPDGTPGAGDAGSKPQGTIGKGQLSLDYLANAMMKQEDPWHGQGKALNNPGHLRYHPDFVKYYGAEQVPGKGFLKFPSWDVGYEALKGQIRWDTQRGVTLRQFVSKYAPPGDNNNTTAYINNVAKGLGIDPDTKLSDALNASDLAAQKAIQDQLTKDPKSKLSEKYSNQGGSNLASVPKTVDGKPGDAGTPPGTSPTPEKTTTDAANKPGTPPPTQVADAGTPPPMVAQSTRLTSASTANRDLNRTEATPPSASTPAVNINAPKTSNVNLSADITSKNTDTTYQRYMNSQYQAA